MRFSATLAPHDLVLVVGSSVFPYYPYVPGPLLPEGLKLVAITSDPPRRRERQWATRSSATSRSPCGGWWSWSATPRPGSHRSHGPRRREPQASEPISGSEAMAALADVWPEDAIAVLESPSTTFALRNRLRLSRPGSYYFSASGGLGFAIAAALGVQLAEPSRPVVCVLGEGSAQYGITALWSAAAYRVPVTYLVLRNDEYAILKWFAAAEQVVGRTGARAPRTRRRRRGPWLWRGRARGERSRGADRGAARGTRRRRAGPAARAGADRGWDVDGVKAEEPRAGLCDSCLHQQLVHNTRGSVFSLCRRSRNEPERFARYPRLPVTNCPGYERRR